MPFGLVAVSMVMVARQRSAVTQELAERVESTPLDAMACFELAERLLRKGAEKDGVRLLGRAIRLEPMLLLQLLQDPSYEWMRGARGVLKMLGDVKRDYDRRLLTAYV